MIIRSICSLLDIGRQEDFGWNFAICSGHFFTFHYCGNSMGSAASHHILHQNNCKFSIHSIIISPPPPYQNFFNLENIRYHFHFCLQTFYYPFKSHHREDLVNLHSSFKIKQNYAIVQPMVEWFWHVSAEILNLFLFCIFI